MRFMRIFSRNWLLIYASLYVFFLYAPVVLLPLFAFNASSIIAFPLTGFTTEWFSVLLETKALHRAVQNSLVVGLITAVISTILGTCAARAMIRFGFPFKRGIVGFIMLPLVLPEIIVAVALLVLLMQLGRAFLQATPKWRAWRRSPNTLAAKVHPLLRRCQTMPMRA